MNCNSQKTLLRTKEKLQGSSATKRCGVSEREREGDPHASASRKYHIGTLIDSLLAITLPAFNLTLYTSLLLHSLLVPPLLSFLQTINNGATW